MHLMSPMGSGIMMALDPAFFHAVINFSPSSPGFCVEICLVDVTGCLEWFFKTCAPWFLELHSAVMPCL
jgi:hypothetical protein